MAALASARPAQLVSLSHVKETSPDPVPAAPKRIAWPGGKITSNKEEATLRFLRKKQSRGEPLTEEQIAVVERSLARRSAGTNADASAAEQPPSPSSARELSPRKVLKKLKEAVVQKQTREGGFAFATRSSPRNAKGKGGKGTLTFSTKKRAAGGRVLEKDGGFVTKRFFAKNTAQGQKRKLGGQAAPPAAKRAKDNNKKGGGGGGGNKKAKRGLEAMLGSTLSTSR